MTLVRSITMDDWSDDQLNYIKFGGNKAFELYLASECGDDAMASNRRERYYHPKINYYRFLLLTDNAIVCLGNIIKYRILIITLFLEKF